MSRLIGFVVWLVLANIGIVVLPAAAEPSRISILVYHRLGSNTSGPMTVTTAVFAWQLAWLTAHRITIVPLHELVDQLKRGNLPSGTPEVALTADDGHQSVYTDMYPLIQHYRMPVTLFIYPSAISNAPHALRWYQLRNMIDSGLVDVQSQTYWHPNFKIEARRLASATYKAFVERQLVKSKDLLQAKLDIKVDLLDWPFGIHDPFLEALAAQAGYIAAFTIERRPLRVHDNLFALPRYIVTNADSGSRFANLILGVTQGDPSR